MIIIAGGEAEGITANAVESFGNKPQEDQEVNSKKVGFIIDNSLSLSLSLSSTNID